jgi:replicative DNA helicase
MAELIRLAAANEADPQRLPRNIEAEAAFLGAILIDNRIIEDVSINLQPDHFFEPLHGRIFEQIQRLMDRNMLVTPVTLKPFFEADEAMRVAQAEVAACPASGPAAEGGTDPDDVTSSTGRPH